MSTSKRPDFVLEYKQNENEKEDKRKRRDNFENELKNILQLKTEETCENNKHKQKSVKKKKKKVKIYATNEVLHKYAEIVKLRMPLKKEFQVELTKPRRNKFREMIKTKWGGFKNICGLSVDKIFPKREKLITAEFNLTKKSWFDADSEDFYKQSDRILLVNYILQHVPNNNVPSNSSNTYQSLNDLLSEGVYSGAYPVKDEDTTRYKNLLKEWGNYRKFYKYQPLDDIKDYFGVKIALYFAWLGFYTCMLIPVSILGIICIIYGISSLFSDTLPDICDPSKNITMCPLCDGCDYWNLTDACFYSEITNLFDNNLTLIFSIVMSFWSSLFVNIWKRYSAKIVHRWGLSNLEPETSCRLPDYKEVNGLLKKLFRIGSAVGSFFGIAILLVALIGIFVFGASGFISKSIFTNDIDTKSKTIGMLIIKAFINLILMQILNHFYEKLATWLTKREAHETQNQFDDSYTLKVYVFQFVNYYSGFFYIAFIKGVGLVGHPANYKRLFGVRMGGCSPGGCLVDLCIQLAIVMIGDQLWRKFKEYYFPKLQDWSKHLCSCNHNNTDEEEASKERIIKGLFDEYLDMIIQYGFVTLFVTAFPLAPLFALINNIVELRGDAKKFLKSDRRPVAQNVKNIGVWITIIEIIGYIAVVSNAFIIAFSSNFIPVLVYTFGHSWDMIDEPDDSGYALWSLSIFNTSDFENNTAPKNPTINATECYYPDFRWPDGHKNKYKKSDKFWIILSARLIFVLAYIGSVVVLKWIVKYLVPEKSKILRKRIDEENEVLTKLLLPVNFN